MERSHGLGGRLAVRSVDVSARLGDAIAADLGERPTSGPTAGCVTVREATGEPPRRSEISGDAGDGRTVGRTASGILVEDRHGWWEASGTGADLEILVGSRTTPWALIREVIRPAIQSAGVAAGTAVIHAAAVAVDDRGVLVAGWSESGKTEIALALTETGARFVGDKWTVVSPATGGGPEGTTIPPSITPFPVRVGVRDWVTPYLPTLAGRLGGPRRIRFAAGGLIEAVGTRAARLASRRKATDAILAPIGQVGSLAATVRWSPDEIRRAYGQPPLVDEPLELGAVVLLTTIEAGEPATIRPVEATVAALRLARSAAYERRGYHVLGERAAVHGPTPIAGFEIVGIEAAAIGRLFAGLPIFELRTPFPADPTIAARLVRDVL